MGIDWTSPDSLNTQGLAMHRVDLIMFGIMLWECTVTLHFDLSVLTGKRPFKWPMAVYWMTKWTTLLFILTVNITNFQIQPVAVNCQVMGDFIDLGARIGMASASGLLMLRTFALWERSKKVVAPLLISYIGMWGLYLHNVFIVRERWSGPPVMTCQIYTVTWPWMKIQFIYTMLFDASVLFLALYALLRMPGRTNLWNLLFLDGISYFIVAFTGYLACTILAYLDISVVLSFMFSDTATVFATIAACRSFQRIATYCVEDRSTIGAHAPTRPAVSTRIEFWKPRPWRSGQTPSNLSTPSQIEEACAPNPAQVHTIQSFPEDVGTPAFAHDDSVSEIEKN